MLRRVEERVRGAAAYAVALGELPARDPLRPVDAEIVDQLVAGGVVLADPGLAVERPPVLLAPMAAILGSRVGRMAMSAQLMRGILDSIATRLDEGGTAMPRPAVGGVPAPTGGRTSPAV